VLWEGTSNINALDAIGRAAAKMGAHEALGQALRERLAGASRVPRNFRDTLGEIVDRAVAFAARASGASGERLARMAAGALYNAATAVLMAWEASRLGDGRRLLLSRMVVEHRLNSQDPLAPVNEAWEDRAALMLLGENPVALEQAAALVEPS
jgi:uncharacterized membrane-anchored protein